MNGPRPSANAVDLARFKRQADLDRLIGTYTTRAAQLRTEGIPVDLILLTARFEVMMGVLATATGTDPDALMQDVDQAAIERALAQIDTLLGPTAGVNGTPRSAAPADEVPE